MKEEKNDRLMLLDQFKGYRVSKGEPDIRGWDVVTTDKRKIGEVHELVIDTVDLKVRYLDVEVDGKVLDLKSNSHVLVPIAGAQLDDDDNRVYLDRISTDELKSLPPYDHRRITRDFENNVTGWFRKATSSDTDIPATPPAPTPATTTPATSATERDPFYDQEPFSDREFWRGRRKGRETETYVKPEEPRSER